MTITFDTDPNSTTVAAGWSSSDLGQPDGDVRIGFTDDALTDADDRRPIGRHAAIAAAVACGIGGGAALGLLLFDFTPSSTAVTPGVGSTPHHPVVVTETNPTPTTVVRAPQRALVPTAIAPAPAAPPAPANGPSALPAAQEGPTIVVDIPIPDYPPLPDKPAQDEPQPPAPEDPAPEPPVLDDLDFKLPEPPKPDPDPVPPVFFPDLPLAPLPKPHADPQPEPPYLAPVDDLTAKP